VSALPAPPPQRPVLLVITALTGALLVAAGTEGWRQGALAFVGVLFGVSLYHSGFGFASAYRHFFVRGDGRGILAQLLMLALATALFAPLLISGAARGAVSPLALQAVFGAALFGVGMQLGSGCACGTLYAIGGGSSVMLITLAGFGAGSFLATLSSDAWKGLPRLEPVSLADRLGWSGVLLQLAVLTALALVLWRWKRPLPNDSQPFWPRADRRALLQGPWATVTGAVALALLGALTLALAGRPWGVTWGFTLWTAKLAQAMSWDPATGSIWQQPRFAEALQGGLLQDTTSVMNAGIVLGAAAAAAAAGRLGLRLPSSRRICLAALLGGLSMGYGAWLSFGCNVGAYFGGIASTSLHGWLWIVFALLGTALGVRLRPLFGLNN
jgi:uncharacterized membrane protein YedE/YeeE